MPVQHHKFKQAKRVFDALNLAFQNGMSQPSLEIVDSKKLVIKYLNQPSPVVRLSEAVYDVCVGVGADSASALAVLLSHELAHHYEKHQFYGSYGSESATVQDWQKAAYCESDADLKGCFYSFLSGYDAYRVFETTLNALYKHFALPDKLNGYSSRQERIEALKKQNTELQNQAISFTAGQYLYAAQDFSAALACFEHLQAFPCAEVLSNLGASALQSAILLTTPSEVPFVMPVELQIKNRFLLKRGTNNNKKGYLLKAINALERLNRIKPNDKSACLNLVTAYILDARLDLALGKIEDFAQQNKKLDGDFYTLKAIVFFLKKDLDTAEDNFIKAQSRAAYSSHLNAKIFQKYNRNAFSDFIDWLSDWFEENSKDVDNQNVVFPKTLSQQATPPKQTLLFTKISEKPYVKILYNADWLAKGVLVIQTERTDYTLLIDKTLQSAASAQYLRMGSTKAEITQHCGALYKAMDTAHGSMWSYQDGVLVCFFNDKNRLTAWFIGSKKPRRTP